jgi:hypothetical protein
MEGLLLLRSQGKTEPVQVCAAVELDFDGPNDAPATTLLSLDIYGFVEIDGVPPVPHCRTLIQMLIKQPC